MRTNLVEKAGGQSKSLIFVSELTSSTVSKERTCLLGRLNSSDSISLHNFTSECLGLITLKWELHVLQESTENSNNLNADFELAFSPRNGQMKAEFQRPTSASWVCGYWPSVRFCQFWHFQCECSGHMGSERIIQTVRWLPNLAIDSPTAIKSCIYFIRQESISV